MPNKWSSSVFGEFKEKKNKSLKKKISKNNSLPLYYFFVTRTVQLPFKACLSTHFKRDSNNSSIQKLDKDFLQSSQIPIPRGTVCVCVCVFHLHDESEVPSVGLGPKLSHSILDIKCLQTRRVHGSFDATLSKYKVHFCSEKEPHMLWWKARRDYTG